jgi:hypothetical protein
MKAPSFYSDPHVQFLSQLLEEIGDGGIQVPRFQRPLVWNWERRLELLRSIRDGIPIGAIMVWRTSTVNIECYDKLGPHRLKAPPPGATRQYLLDGVQRLSTLYGALYRTRSQVTLSTEDLPSDVESNDDLDEPTEAGLFDVFFDTYKEDFVGPHEIGENNGLLMPLSLVFDSVSLLRYQRTLSDAMDDRAIKSIDQLARAFRDYKLPVIPITTDDINLATRTFQRINSQGARMSETHMVHALTWQPGFDLQHRLAELRDEILSQRGWGTLENDTILKSCKAAFGLDVYKASADELSRALVSEPEVLTRVFDALAKVADFLWEDCGIRSPELVPYALQIVVLAEAFRVNPAPNGATRRLLSAWLWMTTYGELFAGMSGDRVQLAISDMHETVRVGVGTWTWRRPFEERPLRRTFDFRAARSKAFAFRLAAVQDEIFKHKFGSRLLADSGRKALTQILPYSPSAKSAYSSPGNRFLIGPAEALDFRERLFRDQLTREERKAHVISDEAYAQLRTGDIDGFVRQRIQDIQRLERRFLQPLLALFEHRRASQIILQPIDVLRDNPNVDILEHNDRSFLISFGDLSTPVEIRLSPKGNYVAFEISHGIHTPVQAGPYWTSRPFAETAVDAMRDAIRSIEIYYNEAVSKGFKPDDSWLVPLRNIEQPKLF